MSSARKTNTIHTVNQSRSVSSVSEYIGIIQRNFLSILALTILALVIGYFVASNVVPMYRATAEILLVSDEKEQLSLGSALNLSSSNSAIESQLRILDSRAVAETVIKNLNLSNHRDFMPQEPGIIATWLKEISGSSGVGQVNRVTKPNQTNEIPFYVRAFQRHLFLGNVNGGSVITVTFESSDRYLAPKIANEIVKVYQEKAKLLKKEATENTIGWLSNRLEQARKDLVQSEAKLRSFQDSANLVDSSEERRVRTDKLGGITSQIVQARVRRADAEAVYHQVQKLLSGKGKEAAVSIVNEERLNALKAKEREIIFEIERLSQRYGEKHPKIIELKNSHNVVKSQIDTLIESILQRVKKDLDLAIANETEANRLFSQIQSELSDSKQKQFELAKLETDVSTNRQLYDMLLVRMKEADINNVNEFGESRVLDEATLPAGPSNANRTKTILFAGLIGFFLGLAMAVYRELSDPTFKTGEELTDRLHYPLLGVIPTVSRRLNRKYLTERVAAAFPRSTIAEAFNNVRTNIIMSKADKPPRIILVSSAIATEGKTTISSNLAISLAALGPTLILEADTRKPRFKRIVKGQSKGGLLEYLSGKSSLKESVMQDTEVDNLFILPVNAVPAKPLELLSSKKFKLLLEDLSKRFSYIVVDSPPVLPVSDSVVLSPLCDGVVIAVAAEKTHKKAVYGAIDRLNRVGANVMGTVLSQANIRTMISYGDHYYYGYEKYESSPKMA